VTGQLPPRTSKAKYSIVEILIWTPIIFLARVMDVGLGTIRVQFIISRRKLWASLIGFVEVLIFILIVSWVIQDLQHWLYVLAYAGGFAAGTLLGRVLTEKLAQHVMQATVISNGAQDQVEAAIRKAGCALTRYQGIGRDGLVAVLDVICTACELARLTQAVTAADPKAFLYTQELAALRGGYVSGLKSKL
jgi:uncharacterized protein YebE (UPF0316 family)